MSTHRKKTLHFPYFTVSICTNDRRFLDLCVAHFPYAHSKCGIPKTLKPRIPIKIKCFKTRYHDIPRHELDCFYGYTIFHNRFAETGKRGYPENRVFYDVGPRTLRTIIDPASNSITSYIATPPDIEKDLLFDLIFFQPLKYLLQTKGLYLLHASCVALNGKAILFSGKPGSGKSVLALSCVNGGFEYMADDEVGIYFDNKKFSISCCQFTSIPKIRKKLLRFFPKLPIIHTKKLNNDKVLVDIKKNDNARTISKVKPHILIYPRFIKSKKTYIEPMYEKTALRRLVREENSYIKYQASLFYKEHFQVLTDLIKQAKAYRLYYRDSDLDKIPQLIRSVLK